MERLTHKQVDDDVRKILAPDKQNGGAVREILQKYLGARRGMNGAGK